MIVLTINYHELFEAEIRRVTKKTFLLFFVLLFCLQGVVFSAVIVGGRTGTLVITSSNGAVLTVGPNDPLPVIQDGSVIKVVNGTAQISTTDTTTVKVVAGNQTFQLAAGTNMNLIYEPSGAVFMEVTAGRVTTVVADGKTAMMGTGNQVRLLANGDIEVVQGEVTLTDSDGNTTTLGPGAILNGYTPPVIPDVLSMDSNVQSEETSRDISPIKS